jgi:hypothetical protein
LSNCRAEQYWTHLPEKIIRIKKNGQLPCRSEKLGKLQASPSRQPVQS